MSAPTRTSLRGLIDTFVLTAKQKRKRGEDKVLSFVVTNLKFNLHLPPAHNAWCRYQQ